jgi:hypothetical protein
LSRPGLPIVNEAQFPAFHVRQLVAAADRRRRAQAGMRQVIRAAPLAACVVLLIGVVGHLVGWPTGVTIAVWAAMAGVLAAIVVLSRRSQPSTDAIAALVDADAGMDGELRSAYWFACSDVDDDWTRYHLRHAAERAGAVSWADVYPSVPGRRAWIATAAFSVAAFVLPVGLPSWPAASASVPAVAESLEAAAELEELPPELRDQLLDLLAAVRSGKLSPEEALAKARDLTAFAQLDAELQQEIADLLKMPSPNRDESEQMSGANAAAAPMTTDTQWARENLASRLANEEAQRGGKEDGATLESSDGKEQGPSMEDPANSDAGEGSKGQAAVRVPMKPTGAPEGSSGMMLRSNSSEVGDPGSMFGGKRGNVKYGTSDAQTIAAALKREMIEANVNIDHSNLKNEDRRKKTEQSWSSLKYTKIAGRSTFDRARADAPQPVPEARRPLVERYFVREASPQDPPAAKPPPPQAPR